MGYKTWVDGDVLTAADLMAYLMKQAVIVCTSGTRPTGQEGMRIHETDTGLRYWHDGSAWYLEGEQILARTVLGAPATSIASGTLNIPDNAWKLRIVARVQNSGGASRDIYLRFNADSGNNYVRQFHYASDLTTGSDCTPATSAILAGTCGNESANRWGVIDGHVLDYRGSSHKQYMGQGWDPRDLAAPLLINVGGNWASTSAITSVSVDASANNFVTGSSLTVYGSSTLG